MTKGKLPLTQSQSKSSAKSKAAAPTQPNTAQTKPVQSTVEELPVKRSPQQTPTQQQSQSAPSSVPNPQTAPNNPPPIATFTEEIRSLTPEPAPEPNPTDSADEAAYAAKTQRIAAWSDLLRSLQPFIWMAVIFIVIIPMVGKTLLFYFSPSLTETPVKPAAEVVLPALPKPGKLDNALVEAVQAAHLSAQTFAQMELDGWERQLEGRVDHFLDWYFGYFNQKKMEFSTPWVWASSAALHQINPNHMTASEAVTSQFTKEFQKQFAKQVLVPKTAQIRLENLTTATINHYLLALRENVNQVQLKYQIPQGQWDRYLADISTTIQDTEGNLSNLSLKMLVGGSGYLLTKPLVLTTASKVGSAVSSKLAGTAAAKLAAKTGGAVAAELGTSLVDPIVGVGIFIWDLWDYQHTVDLERPVLRANLLDYLHSVEQSLLNAPETGILSAIAQLEQGIFKSL
ncbi:MAG: hypothetical protein F6J87_06175 [Spirulina sp. SIO3F2]|nr:hypothetical protein [Spirulina sp. SIO3F2]